MRKKKNEVWVHLLFLHFGVSFGSLSILGNLIYELELQPSRIGIIIKFKRKFLTYSESSKR